ncbi:MAG: hypothetical protein ACO3ZG_02910 [Kiritimatiellia bacterium]
MRTKISKQIASIAALTAVIATTTFAQSEPVYSVNVIGMQKVQTTSSSSGGYSMIAMPFDQVISDLDSVVGTNGVANNSSFLADQVLIYDPEIQRFNVYWLYGGRKWVSNAGFATNITLRPGGGAWYLSRASESTTITLVGDVVDDAAVTNSIFPGLQILSYPYSSPVVLSDLALTNGVSGPSPFVSDNIMIYNPSNTSFSTYWLFSDRKWVSNQGYATNVVVNPGSSFWYLSRGSEVVEWVENKPYDL